MGMWRWIVAAVLLLSIGVAVQSAVPPPAASGELTLPQSDYIEQCGGCHGLQGSSAPARIPVLRGRVGYYMCLPEGRAYLVRLPNVAHSRITDNDQLAALLNFVVFGLGGGSTPAAAKPFDAGEIAEQRQHPMSAESLIKARATLVDKLIRKCGAPASLRLFDPDEKLSAR